MELKITYYKKSGKYYTEHVIKHDKDINYWEKEFYLLIQNDKGVSNPNEFYITVEDLNDNQSFHQMLILDLDKEIRG